MSADAWLLSDAAAGNRRQVQALAAALALRAEAIVLQPQAPWRWVAPRRSPGDRQAFGPAFAARLGDRVPPLAIGCGRQAALATRLLRARGARAVQILDPRLPSRHWDAVIAPAHDRIDGANVIRTLGSLHDVDADWLAAARTQWQAFAALPAPRCVVLLGGPTAAVPLTEREWTRIRDVVRRWVHAAGGSVSITSSRRTPDWLRVAARSDFAGVPGLHWHGANDGVNPYPGLLAWADRLVVTADSVNQLSEACATGAPVSTLLPQVARGRIAQFHRALLDSDRIRPLQPEFEPWTYAPLREAAAVAQRLREWGMVRAPEGGP